MSNMLSRTCFTLLATATCIASSALAQSAERKCNSWTITVAATNNGQVAEMNSIAALSTGQVWAVGSNLIEKWTGSQWVIDKVANTTFYAVTAISPSDVWAGGTSSIWHFDGANWQADSLPGAIFPTIRSLSATASNNVWAAGFDNQGLDFVPILYRWNGATWTQMPTPLTGSAILNAVAVTSSTDVWLVGLDNSAAFILHWDGAVWTKAALPSSPYLSELLTISAVSPTDIWAGGYQYDASNHSNPLMLHWNGSTWNSVPSVAPFNGKNQVNAIGNAGSSHIWAIGQSVMSTPNDTGFSETWTGSTWQKVRTATTPGYSSALVSVAPLPNGEVWAAGSYSPTLGFTYPMIQRYTPCSH